MKINRLKMSVITDEISQEPQEAIFLAKKYGFRGIELRSVWDTPAEQLNEGQLQLIWRLAQDNGLEISAISTSLLKVNWGQDETEKFQKIVNAAHFLGCSLIRGFSFWKDDQYSDADYARILEEYDALLGREKLTMVVENDPAVNLPTATEIGRFFGQYQFENIGVLWDPGNDIYTEGAPIPYPYGYRLVKDHIRHVHLKDAIRRNGETVGTVLGKGLVDYNGQLRALMDSGYQGWITLETHYKKTGVISEELLRRPGGAAFSAGGYEATEECMVGLKNILEALDKEIIR